jgi:hypothetical protein
MKVAGPFVAIIAVSVLLGILIQACFLLLGARFSREARIERSARPQSPRFLLALRGVRPLTGPQRLSR